MKSMKSLIANICILAMVGMMIGIGVLAADTATVNATVTVQNIAVSVSDGTVAYGTMGQNSTKGTHSGDMNDTQVVTNDGNVIANFNIKAIADASTPNWTIGGTAGTNIYVHQICSASCTTPLTNYEALTTSYSSLQTGVAASGGTANLDLYINTPNLSTVYTVQTVSVTVQAVAG